MTKNKWVVLDEVMGMLEAEIIRGVLEAQEITTLILNQEGAGRAIGFTLGILGTVQLLVLEGDLKKADAALEEYYQKKKEG